MRTRKGQGVDGSKARTAAPRLTITISGARPPVASELRRVCRETLQREGILRGRLDVAVVNAAVMRTLHRRWMADDTPTDVLTFDLRDDPEKKYVEAQLVVCESVARVAARRNRGDWRRELALYAVHGCLHLCGYDDRRATDAARMHRREDEILTALGCGAVYHSPDSAGVRRPAAEKNRRTVQASRRKLRKHR